MKKRASYVKFVTVMFITFFLFNLTGCNSILPDTLTDKLSSIINADKLTEDDENALAIIEECMDDVEDGFHDNLDNTEMLEIFEESIQALNDINENKCSEHVSNLLKETKLYINDYYTTCEILTKNNTFLDEYKAIIPTDVTVLLEDFTTLAEIKTSYEVMCEFSKQLTELDCPPYYKDTINRLSNIYDSYSSILADYYTANYIDDYLSIYSDYALFNEILSECNDIVSDFDLLSTEFSDHMDNLTANLTGTKNEILNNIECIEDGNYDKLDFSYLDNDKKLSATINCIDTLYPAMYNSLDAVTILTLSCAQGDLDVLVSVEIEGFSQKYEQTITLGLEPQRFYIKPPVLSSGINLNSQKNSQIKVTVSDISTGNTLASETTNVTIMSINDFILNDDEYGYTNRADILAWVTPESDYIQEILRYAAVYMGEYIGYEGILGYQPIHSDISEISTTALQVYAIQQAISDIGVRYVASSYSIGDAQNATQRVNRPDETLTSKSGICIETAVLMASALQAANFDSMLVFTTGHCQVAVETWADSGEYLLIETTLLPVGYPFDEYGADTNYLNALITYMSDEEWGEYIADNNGIIYNCNMATALGITPLTY